MKIGIITFHCAPSYGAFFQTYALVKAVESLGHSVEVIDYMPRHRAQVLEESWKYPRFSAHRLGLNRVAWLSWQERRLFISAAKKYLPLSSRRFDSYESLVSGVGKYDVCIVGSDQIWNPEHTFGEYDPAYFARFGSDSMKRVSYAASFGVADIGKIMPELKSLLCGLDHISVRENSGIQIVMNGCGRRAVDVLDPTLLLSPSGYPRCRRVCAGKYLLVYNLQHNVTFAPLVDAVKKRLRVKVVDLRESCGFAVGKVPPSPVQVLDLIRNAEFVLTNSFHGCVLSALHHVPFAAIPLEGDMKPKTERIRSVLNRFGIAGRLIQNASDRMEECLSEVIDWYHVDHEICQGRKKSLSFLKNALVCRHLMDG